jgi:hypothetical protein
MPSGIEFSCCEHIGHGIVVRQPSEFGAIYWVKAQAMDPVIKPFIKYVRERRKPKAADVGPTPLLRQFSHLRLVDDVLYREVIIGEDRKRQLVLPTAINDVIILCIFFK